MGVKFRFCDLSFWGLVGWNSSKMMENIGLLAFFIVYIDCSLRKCLVGFPICY